MTISAQLRELIACYDVFWVDQFGTLHNGMTPYPGAVQALLAMRAADKTVVILSNSGRSGADNAARLMRLGFPASSFNHFVTSGDLAVERIRSGAFGIPLSRTTRCFTISSEDDRNLAVRLGLTVVEDPTEADLVVISGSQADRIGLDAYRELLHMPAEARVPAICTNPDIEMITPDGLAPAAGAIARLYEAMGGKVQWIGKPYSPIYEYAHRLCGCPSKDRIVAIGDSLEHDAAGAAGFGIDAVLVRKGVSGKISSEVLWAKAAQACLRTQAIVEDLA